jgi:lactobin A/cerein 7B family class IIb bacteriocin
MQNLSEMGVTELRASELETIDGGAIPVFVAGVLVGAGGVIILGLAAYGAYRLITD